MYHTFTQDVQPISVSSFPQHGSGGHASQGHVQLLPQCGPRKYVSAAEFVDWSLFKQLSGTSDIKQLAEKIATQLSSTARGAAAPRESHISLKALVRATRAVQMLSFCCSHAVESEPKCLTEQSASDWTRSARWQ